MEMAETFFRHGLGSSFYSVRSDVLVRHFTDKTQLGLALHYISDFLTPSAPAHALGSSAAGQKPFTLACR